MKHWMLWVHLQISIFNSDQDLLITLKTWIFHVFYYYYYYFIKSWDSIVGIVTAHSLDDGGVGVQVPFGSRIFSSPSKSSRLALGSTQPSIQWVPGVLSPGVKWPGREADHSPPASAEVKKMWIYTSTAPYAFMA
jgi:hypothetical protein